MHATAKSRVQQKQIQQTSRSCDAFQFFNLLTSDALLDEVESAAPEFRERVYPPAETLSIFLAQCMSPDGSCQNAVNEMAIARMAGGLPAASTRTGAYCKARKRLPLDMAASLCRKTSSLVAAQLPEEWLWRGHRVRIVDGTTLSMPDTKANQSQWPQQSGQADGLGFPVMRAVGVTCWATGMLIDAAMGAYKGKGGSEHSLLRSIEGSLEEGDLLMADALYSSYFFLASMQHRGVDILVEQNAARKTLSDFRKGKKLGKKDHIISIRRPAQRPDWMGIEQFEALPECITLREFKSGDKILITSLCDAQQYSKDALKKLYKTRWRVELTLRDIKQTLGMDVLRCKTPDMIVKEFWAYLLAYNLIRLLMAQAAVCERRDPASLSFKHCLQLWLTCQLQSLSLSPDNMTQLMVLMCQKTVGNRAGRMEPRAIKRRPKPIGFLMVTRKKARSIIAKKGHQRRIK